MKHAKRIKKLPPTSSEARDEGPRLIPIDNKPQRDDQFDPASGSYVALADRALKLWAKSAESEPPRSRPRRKS